MNNLLVKLTPWRTIWAIGADWCVIMLCFALGILIPQPIILLLCCIIIARTQLALTVLMHEAAHGLISTNRLLNNLIGQLFCASPLLLSLYSYRVGHLKHHQKPMAIADPVAIIFHMADYPIPRWKLLLRFLSDLTMIAYFTSMAKFIRGDYKVLLRSASKPSSLTLMEVSSGLIINGLILLVFYLCQQPILYLLLWVLPSLTLLPLMGRIRAIMEHAALPYCLDQSQNARTIVSPSWQTFLFGPHAIHYHIEHHLYPHIPFYQLNHLHHKLAEQQRLPRHNLYDGYGQVLKDVTY